MNLPPKETIGVILAGKSYLAVRDLLEKARVGNIHGTPQNPVEASYAPKLAKEDGRLFFNISAERWDRVVRGYRPWPGAFVEIHSERLGLISVRPRKMDTIAAVGTIHEITEDSLIVQTAQNCIELVQVKPAGKKGMSGADYARGRRWRVGMRLQ